MRDIHMKSPLGQGSLQSTLGQSLSCWFYPSDKVVAVRGEKNEERMMFKTAFGPPLKRQTGYKYLIKFKRATIDYFKSSKRNGVIYITILRGGVICATRTWETQVRIPTLPWKCNG